MLTLVAMASRDLRAMVSAELLTARGERRGRLYVGTEYLRAIANRIRDEEPKEIPNPFVSGVMMIG